MSIRKFLLLVMLAALGLAALAGVAGVLLASGDTLWRVTGTAIATAVAAGLLLPVSLLVDRPKLRAAGLAGMATLVMTWLLVNAAIWIEALTSYWRFLENMLMALGATIAFGIAATIALLFVSLKSCRAAVILLSASLGALLLMAYTGAAVENVSNRAGEKIYAISWVLSATATFVALIIVNIGLDRRLILRIPAILATLVATTIAVTGIITGSDDDFWGRIMIVGFALGGGGAFANLCLQGKLPASQAWLRWATIAAAGLCVVCISGYALSYIPYSYTGHNVIEEYFGRGITASSILAGCGALALIVLARINRRVDATSETFVAQNITLFCPRCSKKQDLPLGDAACNACGLRISTRVEEPRCATCGYLLYKLTSDRCPECGTPVTRTPRVYVPTENT